jgi:aldehyde:ferredoxin oxidoreductase
MQVKGIELGAHGVRSRQDMNPRSYSINTQGGDHCSTAGLTYDRGMLDDTLVLCGFWRADNEEILQFLNASTGFGISEEEMNTVLLPRWTTLQWAPLVLAGWTHGDNTNPPRCFEPLPSGPFKGRRVSKAEEQQMIQEAFQARGWDRSGIPTPETLEELGLPYLEGIMKPYRSRA